MVTGIGKLPVGTRLQLQAANAGESFGAPTQNGLYFEVIDGYFHAIFTLEFIQGASEYFETVKEFSDWMTQTQTIIDVTPEPE